MTDSLLTREAAAAGVSRRQLDGRQWQRTSHGVYTRIGTTESALTRYAALNRVLPADATAAHLTAGLIHRLWLPALPPWLPSLVMLAPGGSRPQRRGVYCFRNALVEAAPTLVAGVPVVSPAVCLGQLAEDLALLDLVVAIDGALHRGRFTTAEIHALTRPRQRGLPRLTQALALCDGRSESPWETVLRLLHVTARIEVVPQYVIRDAEGAFIARADLRIRGTRRLSEYDGAHHRERERHQSDLRREKALAREGWQRYGYTAREIVGNPASVIRDAEEALGLRHDSARLDPWRPLVEASTLTARGRDSLARRLARFVASSRSRAT